MGHESDLEFFMSINIDGVLTDLPVQVFQGALVDLVDQDFDHPITTII